MTIFRKLALVAAVALTPAAVSAAPISPATYDALDYNGQRSIWTPGGDPTSSGQALVTGNGASGDWSFEPGSTFLFTGGKARLQGRAVNNGQSNLVLDFDLKFNVKGSGNTPYCQQPGAGGSHNCATTFAGIDPSDWTFFSITSAIFTGVTGSHLEGLSWLLESNPTHSPQAGEAANALETSGLGFSMWFTFMKQGTATSPFANLYTFNEKGKGDINIDLEENPGAGGVIPLPAAAWMLLAGVGALGAVGRRKKKAA